jgi:hypothetical protein
MRMYIEIDEHNLSVLRELAREHYRHPRHHASWLLAEAIARAFSKRERAREQHGFDQCEAMEIVHAPA